MSRDISSKIEIRLRGLAPFGRGASRLCFVHPDHSRRCIKITKPGRDGKSLRAARGFRGWLHPASGYDDSAREFAEIRRLEGIGGDAALRHIPRHFGFVETDLGRGAVTALLRNFDGSPPPTLREEILRGGLSLPLKAALAEFRAFLRDGWLAHWDAAIYNILVVQIAPQQIRLFIVDGLGRQKNLIPLTRMFALFRKRRALMRAALFEKRVARLVASRAAF